jgi:hypothetical protein
MNGKRVKRQREREREDDGRDGLAGLRSIPRDSQAIGLNEFKSGKGAVTKRVVIAGDGSLLETWVQ